jgi:hypothetical protein
VDTISCPGCIKEGRHPEGIAALRCIFLMNFPIIYLDEVDEEVAVVGADEESDFFF